MVQEHGGYEGTRAWPREATLPPRVGAADERSYLTSEGRGSGREELPCIWGKEQPLRFAGAAMKRDLMSNVRETQVRR